MEPLASAADETEPADITDTERAVYGSVSSGELQAFLDAWLKDRLRSPIAKVRFRAGRIDVVWGVELEDGRAVVIKTHRSPVHLDAIRVAHDAQRLLAAAGFPCAVPLAGPDEIEGRVLTAETLIDGATPDGRDPACRLLLAKGLAQHIEILRDHPDVVRRAGPGPSWCHYQSGPWPVPHDTLVDFRSTPDGFEWLDTFGRRAADQILAHRDQGNIVVGHADWYAGNTAISGNALVGTFDWELVADTEAVIAGFAAACYAAGSTGGGGLSTPEEAAMFLRDYDTVRAGRFLGGNSGRLRARPPGSLRSTLAGRSGSSTTASATRRRCRWSEIAGMTICRLSGDADGGVNRSVASAPVALVDREPNVLVSTGSSGSIAVIGGRKGVPPPTTTGCGTCAAVRVAAIAHGRPRRHSQRRTRRR